MATAVRRFWSLPTTRKRLLLEAVPALILARCLMFLPYRLISKWFGMTRGETRTHADESSSALARDMGWAVHAASARMPFACECMVQALAGKMITALHGLDAVIVIGVTKDETRNFKAHAWLRHGDVVLTGDDGLDRFNTFKGRN